MVNTGIPTIDHLNKVARAGDPPLARRSNVVPFASESEGIAHDDDAAEKNSHTDRQKSQLRIGAFCYRNSISFAGLD